MKSLLLRSSAITAFSLFAGVSLVNGTATSAYAQVTSGNVAGVVKDATGAVVPNASIVIKNESTGVDVKTTANGSGEYLVQNLLPGRYDVTASAPGFAASTLKGIAVSLSTTVTADVAVSAGSQSTTVEVDADSVPVLDTTTQNLTTSFTNTELSDLPTSSIGGAGQSGVLNVSLLSPGVASSGGLGIGVGPSVGGQRPRNNNFTIEGIDNNNKAVTGPLVYTPNDAVGSFSLITNQFSPEFGHSSGGQFNTNIESGTNTFHGRLYEYFQNRNLNAASGIAGGKIPNPKYDNNRYGGQLGGPIFRDKLFFFANYERNTVGQNASGYVCVPNAAGIATINNYATSFNTNNLQQLLKYLPAANFLGGAQVTDANDNACATGAAGPQFTQVTDSSGTAHNVALGNYQINASAPILFNALTVAGDYTISTKDSLRLRYIYNTESSTDTSGGISLPAFYTQQPFKYHLVAFSEYHTFTPNLINEFRLGFNRFANTLTAGNFTFPGLDSYPTFQYYDLGDITYGPDGNAPQFTIQNLYQATDNISYTRGKHTLKIGFDGRKYISPQGFTQRARGDYQYSTIDVYLHDLAPDVFAERSSGNHTYYGDQTALYGYANDTWRATPTVTFNVGLRYEFTSVPVGERSQSLNAAASVPGLITFNTPQPAYGGWAPRVGVNWAPDANTSVRAGFGLAYDVLFDNLGTLSFPPQYSVTEDVGTAQFPLSKYGTNFLTQGGLPPGSGSGTFVYPSTPAGLAQQRADTSAYIPNQVNPYAETYTLTVQHTFAGKYTAEIGYVGTRGIHLPTQTQINIQPRVTNANSLPTYVNGSVIAGNPGVSTLASLSALSNIVPAYKAAGFTSKITSYQPYSSSNYNGLVANLTRRLTNGLQMNLSYTYSKTLDNATAEVFATVLTPRRPQNSQCIACEYSRSALDRTHRISLEALYDLPLYKHSDNFIKRNVIGNWTITPIYTYESPEYATVLSGVNSNLNGDSGSAIDRTIINPNGIKGTSTKVTAITNANGDVVGYSANTPTAYYIQAGAGTSPNGARNTLPIRPIDNIDLAAYKRITVFDHYSLEFGAQAFNVLNHAQYIPGTIDNVNGPSYTSSYAFQTVGTGFFNHPEKQFLNNARTMQLTGKFVF